jgi:hypothetical protein
LRLEARVGRTGLLCLAHRRGGPVPAVVLSLAVPGIIA